jgi:thioredoxin 2
MTRQPTMNNLQVICPNCEAINRLPRARLGDGGKCGSCHKPLFSGLPVALDEAKFARHIEKDDLPLLVDFWAPWCGPCRAMAPEFERAARSLEPRVRLAKVNVDEAPNLAQRYGIRSIPTLAIIHRGREIARTGGAMPAAELARWVQAQRLS